MPHILNTNGQVITDSVEDFELYDVIRHSAARPDSKVSLVLANAGHLDISYELGIVPVVVTAARAGNSIVTGRGNDTLYGGGGDDTLSGGSGNDLIRAGAGNNTVYGGAGNDTVIGTGGHDTVYGDAGNDHFVFKVPGSSVRPTALYGGDGNDRFEVNLMSGTIDGGTGKDTLVQSYVSKNMQITNVEVLVVSEQINGTVAQLESFTEIRGHIDPVKAANWLVTVRLTTAGDIDLSDEMGSRPTRIFTADKGNNNIITGSGDDSLTGSAGRDSVRSGDGNDIINLGGGNSNWAYGGTGHDTIIGGTGADTIYGGSGSDRLESGGSGADVLYGGSGGDYYVIGRGTRIYESAGEGDDTVESSVTHVLGANFENLYLTGDANINATGNNSSNEIIGNSGNNTLTGNGGVDYIQGGGGDDTYIVDSNDTVLEQRRSGNDTVKSWGSFVLLHDIETLILLGSSSASATGDRGANTIIGNTASNAINGKAGMDILTGGLGRDTFVFDSPLGRENADVITDFEVSVDTIKLDDSVFRGLSLGALSKAAFAVNTTGFAGDATDRVIYERDTGRLYFDRDGTGSAARFLFAELDAGLSLTSADFLVF